MAQARGVPLSKVFQSVVIMTPVTDMWLPVQGAPGDGAGQGRSPLQSVPGAERGD